jgi:hypothetical protein
MENNNINMTDPQKPKSTPDGGKTSKILDGLTKHPSFVSADAEKKKAMLGKYVSKYYSGDDPDTHLSELTTKFATPSEESKKKSQTRLSQKPLWLKTLDKLLSLMRLQRI